MVYDENGDTVECCRTIEGAIQLASEYYFDKHKKE